MQLNDRTRGWLRHLWRKATTEDDWSRGGEPHPWWDQYSMAPMLSFPRFDLSESSYALLLMGRKTPAWREVYTRILDELVRRHTTHWAAVDWLTQFGPDPDRASYPKKYKGLIPKDLWGEYDVPGWTANGIEPWGRQPDPIGADGNLFFRGFLTLLLGIHRAVSGEKTWEKPFEMVGLDDQTFAWTHSGIATYLSDHWAQNPEGPHCENTKVWPYCLSAAGLGLQMTDLTVGSATHGVYDEWLENIFRKRFLSFDGRGNLKSVGLYHDPQLNRTHRGPRAGGLAPAFYILPQNREMAELLYRNAVASVGWDRRWLPVIGPKSAPRMFTIGLLLAREFGDWTTERRLMSKLGSFDGGRYFNANPDDEADENHDEFGFFFEFGEAYPRGQESALLMLRDLVDGEAGWSAAFNESDSSKFSAPTVEGVDYPRMGLSSAENNETRCTLDFQTYVATRSEAGIPTRFRITQIPDVSVVQVLRDGSPYENWTRLSENTIEIETTVAENRFSVYTGYRADASSSGGAEAGSRVGTEAHLAPARLRPTDLARVSLSQGTANLGCPCCG
ncbi:MAG TPA: hypothetical protein EYG06_03845 [Myxococcales bacterium]|nr:hypothetical protein [Myxococcales bacterium]